MPRPIVDAATVTVGQRGWTCIIQVIERHPILLKELRYHPFQKRYRPYLLTDMQGTKVKAVMFDKDIEFFERNLQPFRRYKLSNATVTLPPERHRLPGYMNSWIITSRCPVEPINDPRPYSLPCTFDGCKFADLHKFAESDTPVAIKALVVHQFPAADINDTVSVKDYVVINEEEIPMVLRLWKDLLSEYDPQINTLTNEPVTIITSNIEVRTFHGLSLATRNNTYLIQNPPHLDDLALKNWYMENKEKVAALIKSKAYENNPRFFARPEPSEIVDIHGAMTVFENRKTCWIKAKIRLGTVRSSIYDIVCGNCHMEVDAGLDWDVECSNCIVLSPMEVRIRLPIILGHDELPIKSTLKSPDAEKICPFSAIELKNHEDEGLSVVDDISIQMDYTEVVAFVKYYDKEIDRRLVRRYVILKLYTLAELQPNTEGPATEEYPTVHLGSESADVTSAQVEPLSPTREHEDTAEAQPFTPTIKNVVEQIAGEVSETHAAHASPAKRAITFGTVTEQDLGNDSSTTLDAKLPNTVGTPTKKTKSAADLP